MKLYSIGECGGDCTYNFEVQFSRKYTVREFLNLVLERNEWGKIELNDGKVNIIKRTIECEYKGKEIIYSGIPDEYMNKYIQSAEAHGGYSCMDYKINIALEGKDAKNKKEI